ncbi:hypothetical protein, partial [Alistipes finegoldii]|uniref:hypothetical protein n=1 Tax=Alistipes finegoldii TaxID=214856 RepID=UPI003AB4BA74
AAPAGTGDLIVMVPLEALQIKEHEGQFLNAGLNGIVSQSVFIVFLFLHGGVLALYCFCYLNILPAVAKTCPIEAFSEPGTLKRAVFHVPKYLSHPVALPKREFSGLSGRK